uniref:ASD2 domain-containing protein n=1 Tax=Panagrolaimus sp. JU765 TaxID=591449 RepID=A0AC34QHD5_9BILA
MLHRSPSGAQRKIRRRIEELTQQRQPSTFSSSSLQSQQSTATETFIDSGYRSLVDSSAYRSILDDMSYRNETRSDEIFSSEKVSINTFSKPEPARRTLALTDKSNNSNNLIEKYNQPLSATESSSVFVNQNYFGPTKPTVEVHPMPAPRSSLTSQPILLQKGPPIPPPIPKKPENLRKKIEQQSSFQDMSISVSPNENEVPRVNGIKYESETSSENAYVIEKEALCNSKPCSSVEALDRLHTSSLVRSMAEEFDGARLSAVDVTELEKRRISSINKLISKIAERTADLDTIKSEKEAALSAIQKLLENHSTLPKIEREIKMRANLIQLEGVARVRLQQINNLTKEQASALQDRIDYWHQKIDDIRYLAIFVSQRIVEIEDQICQYLSKEDFVVYKKNMELLIELEAENTETKEKLDSVQKQIEQLQNICPLPGANKT